MIELDKVGAISFSCFVSDESEPNVKGTNWLQVLKWISI